MKHEYIQSCMACSKQKIVIALWVIASLILLAMKDIIFYLSTIFMTETLSGNVIIISLSVGTIYAAIFWLFNQYIWKWSCVRRVLKVPDLNGKWLVDGKSHNVQKASDHKWNAYITIVQSWDMISITLKTRNSIHSESTLAKITYQEGCAYNLEYCYAARSREPEKKRITSHMGSVSLYFDLSEDVAEGNYFNNGERQTFGKMKLTRI